jgi:peptidyl-prolyl cis-trans isomerase SurA
MVSAFAFPCWRGVSVLALLLVPSAAIAAPTRATGDVDRILAIVNDDIITDTELDARLAQTKRQLAVEKIKLPTDSVLRRQLLERMVVERLQLQLAERAGIRASDADVERAIEGVARQNKMELAEFRKTLVREGLDPQIHAAEVRTQIILRQLAEREVNNRITVNESEIENFLETNPRGADTEYNLSHIFLPLPESASSEAIQATRKRADEILARLKDGANFEQLAVSHSQGEGAMSGGAIGWRKAGQLPELFVTTLRELSTGSVSSVLRGPNGFHILKLNNRRGESAATNVTQTRVRHILLRRSEIQSLDEARAKLLSLRERIVQGDDFVALARAHSEDTGSAAGGGELGWTSPGQLVPEFEQAMNALKPGEISQPVRSSFGLHLIQVLERRTQDLSDERLRGLARQQIHTRKASERYEQWLRQLRDEAYVEYLSDDVN